jgi:hypothetical protein
VFRASETKRSSWLQHGGKLKKIEAKLFITIANLAASAALRIDTPAHHAPAGTTTDGSHANSMDVVVTPELAVRELMVTAKVQYKSLLYSIIF